MRPARRVPASDAAGVRSRGRFVGGLAPWLWLRFERVGHRAVARWSGDSVIASPVPDAERAIAVYRERLAWLRAWLRFYRRHGGRAGGAAHGGSRTPDAAPASQCEPGTSGGRYGVCGRQNDGFAEDRVLVQ